MTPRKFGDSLGEQFPYMKTVTFKTVGDLELQADVYGADTPNYPQKPTLVWIHGGALIMGTRSRIVPEHIDRYLSAGFVVVSIDYRLAPETKLPEIAEDIEDAFSWLRSTGASAFGIDPDRVGVVGHSAGGYLTLLAGHRVKPTPKVLVAFYGYGDITGDWYSQPDPFYNTFVNLAEGDAHVAVGGGELVDGSADPLRRDFYLWCRQNGLWPLKVGGHDPVTERDWFTQYSPAENVTSESGEYPPTLLIHGDADTDVPYEQSVLMADRLGHAGIEHEFITIPGGPHGFDHNPETAGTPEVAHALDRVVEFLVAHV